LRKQSKTEQKDLKRKIAKNLISKEFLVTVWRYTTRKGWKALERKAKESPFE